MTSFGFPQRTKSQHTGQVGEVAFHDFITRKLGWIFRPVHQEHDFGIDGYIDIVEENSVTGRSLAVQVKCGDSFFKKKTPSGFKFEGDNKHLNFYLNLPVPVVIVLISADGSEAFWAHFKIENTSPCSGGWWIEISKSNELSISVVEKWKSISGATADYSQQINSIWKKSKEFEEADFLLIAIPMLDIISNTFGTIESIISRFSKNSQLLLNRRNRVNIFFPDYDEDPREIYQIPEIREWIKCSMEAGIPWFYLLSYMPPYHGLILILSCATDILQITRGTEVSRPGYHIASDSDYWFKTVSENFKTLNKFTSDNNIAESINKKISEGIRQALETILYSSDDLTPSTEVRIKKRK